MKLYCVHVLEMSEDVAFKRIRAARAARKFPVIFHAIADGRVHLAAVVLLAPHFTARNVDELLAAATHKTKAVVELLVAERFPKSDLQALVQPIFVTVPAPIACSEAPSSDSGPLGRAERTNHIEPLAPGPVVPSISPETPMQMVPVPAFPKFTPLSPGRFAMQYTMSARAYEKLRYVQELLGHAVPSGDVEQVMERALDALARELEREKFAATPEPRARRSAAEGRYIPAEIKREVWARDGGKCTFVSETGKRCESRTRVEMDHVVPVAKGGQTSVSNLRLLCSVHNQFEAERAFGSEFMRGKREAARSAAVRAPVASSPS